MGACRCDEPRDTGHRAIQSLSHWAIVDSEPVVCVGFLTVGPRSPLPTLAPARRRRLREQGRHQFLPVTPEVEGAIHPDLDVDLVAGRTLTGCACPSCHHWLRNRTVQSARTVRSVRTVRMSASTCVRCNGRCASGQKSVPESSSALPQTYFVEAVLLRRVEGLQRSTHSLLLLSLF